MIRLDIDLSGIQLDGAALVKAIDNAIIDQLHESARAFLRAAIPRIPVDTGMARGTLLNIGRLINELVPISPRSTGRLYYPGGLRKTPATGARLSTKSQNVVTSSGNVHAFNFSTAVRHFNLLDPSWGATAAGLRAFVADFKRQFPSKIPPISEFVKRQLPKAAR